ncbi:hypothetical protein [Paraglaciecola sp. 2405UD69-4]|uniref:hypothetical protein n=1 Tax=Paraglaciecola sp. 2405UD69-4 TaxID=3391836 RepID=UPI0039C9E072
MINRSKLAVGSTIYQAIENNQYHISSILNWAISLIIHKPTTAIVCGGTQSMMATFASQAGFDLMFFADEAKLKRHGFWYWDEAVTYGFEKYLLGNENTEYRITPRVEAGFEQLSHLPEAISKVTFDEQYAGIKHVSWIHIAYINSIDILRGLKKRIKHDLPIVTLSSIAIRQSFSEYRVFFSELDYILYDSKLAPINDSDSDCLTSAMLVAIPLESNFQKLLCTATKFSDQIVDAHSSEYHAELIKRYYSSLLTYETKSTKLLESCLFADNQSIDLQTLIAKGLHPIERSGETSWRWTGAARQSIIQLPIPSAGYYFFRIHLGDLPGGLESNVASIFIDGKQVAFEKVYSGAIIEFGVTFAVEGFEENAMLLIETEKRITINGKTMGLAVVQIEVFVPKDELL